MKAVSTKADFTTVCWLWTAKSAWPGILRTQQLLRCYKLQLSTAGQLRDAQGVTCVTEWALRFVLSTGYSLGWEVHFLPVKLRRPVWRWPAGREGDHHRARGSLWKQEHWIVLSLPSPSQPWTTSAFVQKYIASSDWGWTDLDLLIYLCFCVFLSPTPPLPHLFLLP